MKPHVSRTMVRGSPIEASGRVFVPEAQVTSLATREALFAANRIGAIGFRVERIRPTALIEQTPGGERRHPIDDATGRAWRRLAIAALLTPIVASTLVNLLSAHQKK